jgi:hypothetical protein
MTEYIANALELFSQLVRSVSTDASVPMYTAIPVVSLAYRLSSLAADHKKSFRHDIEFDPDKVARETLAAMSKCEERGLDDAEVKAIERAALAESKATFLSEVCRVFAAFAVAQREYTRSYSWTLSKLHRAFGLENETQERHSLAALVVASTDEEASWLYKRMATYTSPACDAGDAIHGFVRSMASVVCARGRGWTLLDLLIVTDDGDTANNLNSHNISGSEGRDVHWRRSNFCSTVRCHLQRRDRTHRSMHNRAPIPRCSNHTHVVGRCVRQNDAVCCYHAAVRVRV